MTKNTSHNPIQKLYRNWTGNQLRELGQFLVKSWSAFQGGQKVSRNGAGFRQRCGKVSVILEPTQAGSAKNQGVQKVDKNRTEKVHQEFTKSSPDFEGLSLEVCRQGDGRMSAVFNLPFVLFPQIAEYMRKSPSQFDIPSSYLYVVVLRKVCL